MIQADPDYAHGPAGAHGISGAKPRKRAGCYQGPAETTLRRPYAEGASGRCAMFVESTTIAGAKARKRAAGYCGRGERARGQDGREIRDRLSADDSSAAGCRERGSTNRASMNNWHRAELRQNQSVGQADTPSGAT
jgi:hypothetical protein